MAEKVLSNESTVKPPLPDAPGLVDGASDADIDAAGDSVAEGIAVGVAGRVGAMVGAMVGSASVGTGGSVSSGRLGTAKLGVGVVEPAQAEIASAAEEARASRVSVAPNLRSVIESPCVWCITWRTRVTRSPFP
jgi:hypothetical protein